MSSKRGPGIGRIILIAFAVTVMMLPISSAVGQGFMVKPMKITADLPPGRVGEVDIQLKNTAGSEDRVLEVSLVDLVQAASGGFMPEVPRPGQEEDVKRMSCREWVSLDAGSVTIPALQSAMLNVKIKTPAGARGVYTAALLVQAKPIGADDAAVKIQVRFLIPIIVSIQGRPVRQNVQLSGLSMAFRPKTQERVAGTIAGVAISNKGRTYSRAKGTVQIEIQRAERWRPVSQLEFPERGILPGMTLNLTENLDKRLPSGRYRLKGTLYVDGRRVTPMEKELDFKGDPDATTLALDTALILDPERLAVNASPGAVRTTVVKVENPSEDPLTVMAQAVIPQSLQGVAMDELRGDALSAAEWVQIRPAKLTLQGERTQNIRIMTRMPREGLHHARYYADIVLHAAYADGQSAGTTRSILIVSNSAVEAAPKAAGDRLALAQDAGSNYIVQAEFSNIGNIELTPTAEAEVLASGGSSVAATVLSGQEGMMLPLGVRQYAGTIDFADIAPGNYVLRARLVEGSTPLVVKQVPITVEEEDGRKVVSLPDAPAATQTAEAAAQDNAKE